jgi:hypothetical protein
MRPPNRSVWCPLAVTERLNLDASQEARLE